MSPTENDAAKRQPEFISSEAGATPAQDEGQAARYIIQIERSGQKLDMASAQALLAGTGVELDAAYGPILVNPKLGRYVVRGLATPSARREAENVPGVSFFSDARQTAVAKDRVGVETASGDPETGKDSADGTQDRSHKKSRVAGS